MIPSLINNWCECENKASTMIMKRSGCVCTTQYPHLHCGACGKVVEVRLPGGEVRKAKEWKEEDKNGN